MPGAVSVDLVRWHRFQLISGVGGRPRLVVPEDPGETVRLLSRVEELGEESMESDHGLRLARGESGWIQPLGARWRTTVAECRIPSCERVTTRLKQSGRRRPGKV